MSSIIFLNYLKARFRYGGIFRKLKRIKFKLEFHDYHLDIDLYSSVYSDLNRLNDEGIKKYYTDLLAKNGEEYGLDIILNTRYNLDSKTLRNFMQIVIIHKLFKVDTYINEIKIKSKSEIRNEKLIKILK